MSRESRMFGGMPEGIPRGAQCYPKRVIENSYNIVTVIQCMWGYPRRGILRNSQAVADPKPGWMPSTTLGVRFELIVNS